MGKRIAVSVEQEEYLRTYAGQHTERELAAYLGCCVDTLRRILMRFGIAEYEGAKYATSTESSVQMWTRPCMRCRCTEPRPKNLYLCDTCRNGTGYSSGIAEPQGFG